MNHKNCKDLTGRRFNRLIVTTRATPPGMPIKWNCSCDCGEVIQAYGNNLSRGLTGSCGCFHREKQTIHGNTNHPLWKTWKNMIDRCSNPQAKGHQYYGGRGIAVCQRWRKSFEDFASDMGPKPTHKHTLDRKNNDGDYMPENCRWATVHEQIVNRSNVIVCSLGEVTDTLNGWAKRCGVSRPTIASRMARKGVSAKDTIAYYLFKNIQEIEAPLWA